MNENICRTRKLHMLKMIVSRMILTIGCSDEQRNGTQIIQRYQNINRIVVMVIEI